MVDYNPLILWAEETIEVRIATFEEFFTVVQSRTGMFEDKFKKPYKLHEKQAKWLSIFDSALPQKRALLGSRKKGKSEIITILGTAWMLYLDPKIKIGIMSRKYANAKKLTNQVLKIMIALGYPLMSTAGGYYTHASNAHTPNLSPLGLMTAVRGMHFDYMILDDPITGNEEKSNKYIDRSRQYLSEAQSIARYTILIGQLLTRNDIYYDAFTFDDEKYYHVKQSWHGDIPELDRDIKVLGKTMSNKDIARNYLGKIDDSAEAIFQNIEWDNSVPSGHVYAYIDPSAKGQDYTAIAIAWINDARIIIYGEIFKQHWGDCIESLARLCKNCRTVYFEDNLGISIQNSLRAYGITSKAVTSTTKKIDKIYALKGMIRMDRLRLSVETPDDAVRQLRGWTETAPYDDFPDSVARLVPRVTWELD